MSKPSYRDIQTATVQELKKTYNLSDKGVEHAIRAHLDGANASERNKEYEKLYRRKD